MLFYLLIFAFYLIFIYFSWKDVKNGIFSIGFLLPTYLIRFTLLGIPTTLLEGLIWLLFIIWLIKLKKAKKLTFSPFRIIKNLFKFDYPKDNFKNPVPKHFRFPIILLLMAACLGVIASPNVIGAMGAWKAYFIDAVAFLLLFVYNVNTNEDIKKVIRMLGWTVLTIGLFAVIQKLTGWLIPNPFWQAAATRRITTFYGYPNANALFVLPIIFLTLINLLSDKRSWEKVFNWLVIILGILTIIFAKSNGAEIGLLFGAIFLLLSYKKTRFATLIILLLFSLGISILPQPRNYLKKAYIQASQIHLNDQPTDIQLRIQPWRETINMLHNRPLFGSGLAGYQTIIKYYHQNRHIEIFIYPHNFFLNFWTETGLIGLIAIIWLILAFFWQCYRNNKTHKCILNIIIASAMIALLVHGLVDVPYFKNDLSLLFWIIIGSVIILHNQYKEKN
jgi:O-antigen ligase